MIRGSDVTVVIPSIEGREHLLARALRSVEAQLVQPGAVVVELDRERTGAAATRNRGLARVETDWVAWLDDDDELLPNHVKVLVRGANRSGADLVYSYPEFVGGEDPLAVRRERPDGGGDYILPRPIDVPFDALTEVSLRLDGNHIPVTYLVRVAPVRAVGGFPEPYSFEARYSRDCEDYGLLLRLLDARARFHHVTGVRTWRYFFHDSNTGGRGADRLHELEGA